MSTWIDTRPPRCCPSPAPAVVDGQLHYFGGLDRRCADAGAPQPVLTVVLEGRLYAIGGQFHHDSEQLDQPRTDIYDPVTDAWSSGPDLPKGHSHAEGATFVHDRRIYMVGGHTTPAGGTKSQDPDILRLTPGGQWQNVGELRVRSRHPPPRSSETGSMWPVERPAAAPCSLGCGSVRPLERTC